MIQWVAAFQDVLVSNVTAARVEMSGPRNGEDERAQHNALKQIEFLGKFAGAQKLIGFADMSSLPRQRVTVPADSADRASVAG